MEDEYERDMTQQTHLQRAKELAREYKEKHGDFYTALSDKQLDEIVTSTYLQAVEACEALVEKHDPNVRMDRKTSSAYWGNKLREELQSLKQTN